jgi:hypothetical protein
MFIKTIKIIVLGLVNGWAMEYYYASKVFDDFLPQASVLSGLLQPQDCSSLSDSNIMSVLKCAKSVFYQANCKLTLHCQGWNGNNQKFKIDSR